MRDRLVLHTAACAMVLAILAPLLIPGYVLSYDMVFVPSQPLVPELMAPVGELPRAVPLDAIIALLSQVFPGWLLQRLALAGIVWAAVVGAGRLVPTESPWIRVLAGVAYGWTPFLAERLLLGQWALLVTYACLPWLIIACLAVKQGRSRALAQVVVTAGLSALTPTGGVIAAIVVLVILAGIPWRRYTVAVGSLILLNSPWLVAAMTSNASGRSDPAGVAAFAARSENWGGPLIALLGTGGIWNRETTPESRSLALIPIVTLLLCSLAIYGYLVQRAKIPVRFTVVALGGLILAASSTVPIGVSGLGWLVEHVPGAGLLRDAQKFALPYALLLVLCLALGVEQIAAKMPPEPARVLVAGMLLIVVGTMPDLGFGGAGALRPVRYPADWNAVAQLVRDDPGEVLSLPLSEYRKYAWNRDRTVKDPAQRYLPAPVLSDDTLIVSGRALEGESPRMQAIRQRLSSGTPITGIRWILVQHRGDVSTAVRPETLRGLELVFAGPHLSLYRDPAAPRAATSWGRHAPVLGATAVALAVFLIGLAYSAPGRRSRKGSPAGRADG